MANGSRSEGKHYRQTYSLKERMDIVEIIDACREDKPKGVKMSDHIRKLAKEVGIHHATYYRWKRDHWKNIRARKANRARYAKEKNEAKPDRIVVKASKMTHEYEDKARFKRLEAENERLRRIVGDILVTRYLENGEL